MRFPLWLCIALFSLLVIAACASQRAPGTDWLARRVAAVPQPIDVTDARWSEAPPAYLPLHEGSHGRLSGDVVELRALYDEIRIAFRARWRGEVLPAASLQFALLWRKDGLPEQRG